MLKDLMNCEAVMRQLWDYLDDELTPAKEAAIRTHLAFCRRCHQQSKFEQAFLSALAASRRDHPRPDEIRLRVATALREEGFVA